MKKMILFIDDEARRMKSYVEELECSGYEVEFKSDVDSALAFFTVNEGRIALIILDVMMPTGLSFNETASAECGLRTGISFHDKIRQGNSNIPVIVLTNVGQSDISCIELDTTFFVEKTTTLPSDLAEKVNLILLKNG
jgi:CheY-like chemotaxis protein